MRNTLRSHNRASALLIVAGIAYSTGCAFDSSFRGSLSLLPLPNLPIADLTASDVDRVFEDPDSIVVYHGSGCAESDRRGEELALKLRQEITVPPYVNAATVFLNGWKVRYLRNEHEVTGLFVSLGGITLSQGTLSWQAVGALSDQNFDDGYSLCYYFTAVGWSTSSLAVIADHEDEDNHEAITNENDRTALTVLSGFLQDSNYPPGVRFALLPRGFGARWEDLDRDADLPDHHLFQLAYNLDYAERFVDSRKEYTTQGQPSLPSSASHVDINVITRDSKTIFKDNAFERDRATGEAVSVLMGADVGSVQPPFTVFPREDRRGCPRGVPVESTTRVVIENVPFRYAVPVLTGWDLAYACNDQEVTEMGVWLDTFSYTRPVVTLGGGTLRYTFSHVLRDRDSHPGSLVRARVHILGFKPILTQGPPDDPLPTPEVVPPAVR